MNRARNLLVAMALLPLVISAQSWCTTGADWRYRLTQFGIDFERHMWYESDLMLGGQNVQRIAVRDSSLISGSQGIYEGYFYSLRIDDAVLLRASGSQYWDTLYFYGNPGQRWWPIGGPDPDCLGYYGMLEIADTCTVYFNNVPKRKWELVYLDEFGLPASNGFDMIEGVGTIPFDMHPWYCSSIVEWYWWEFLSYTDDQIGFDTWPAWDDCNSIPTSSSEIPGEVGFTLFPNPGNNVLHISGSIGEDFRVRIHDGTGRFVSETMINGRSVSLNTENLMPGLYNVTISGSNGKMVTRQWSKVPW